jgi:hypothetical protein
LIQTSAGIHLKIFTLQFTAQGLLGVLNRKSSQLSMARQGQTRIHPSRGARVLVLPTLAQAIGAEISRSPTLKRIGQPGIQGEIEGANEITEREGKRFDAFKKRSCLHNP